MRDCPNCKVSLNDDVATCPYCGDALPLIPSDPAYWDAELAKLAGQRERRARRLKIFEVLSELLRR